MSHRGRLGHLDSSTETKTMWPQQFYFGNSLKDETKYFTVWI